MIKNMLKQNWKRFLLIILLFALFNAVWFGLRGVQKRIVIKRDEQTIELLQNISYTEDNSIKEVHILENYLTDYRLSEKSLGLVHKSMAKLYYMTGDDHEYNSHVGEAFYYLDASNEYNELADLYTQYMGILYANGAYKDCEKLMEDMTTKIDLDTCADDIQIAYYLGIADTEEMLGKEKEAKYYIDKAKELLKTCDSYEEKEVDLAKSNLLLARMDIDNEDFASAKTVLSGYSESDTFGLEKDNLYLICDYVIPYHEMHTKLLLSDEKYEEAVEEMKTYLEYCDEYNFRRMKLNMLNYMSQDSESNMIPGMDEMKEERNELANETLNEFSDQYGDYLLTEIDDCIEDIIETENHKRFSETNVYVAAWIVFILVFAIVFIRRIVSEMRIDGLTRLRNRKCYEEDRERLFHRKESHYFIIFDIDNFKNINDTYGHHVGDEVLTGISDILKKSDSGYIRCYRYGGEELCMIIKNSDFETAYAIAEQTRKNIENMVSKDDMKVTVSGGMAYSSDGGNAFRRADGLLYEAKANGKNQIIFER